MKVTVFVMIAPDYPACLYGSVAYATDATVVITYPEGEPERFTQHRVHPNRADAFAFASATATSLDTIKIVD